MKLKKHKQQLSDDVREPLLGNQASPTMQKQTDFQEGFHKEKAPSMVLDQTQESQLLGNQPIIRGNRNLINKKVNQVRLESSSGQVTQQTEQDVKNSRVITHEEQIQTRKKRKVRFEDDSQIIEDLQFDVVMTGEDTSDMYQIDEQYDCLTNLGIHQEFQPPLLRPYKVPHAKEIFNPPNIGYKYLIFRHVAREICRQSVGQKVRAQSEVGTIHSFDTSEQFIDISLQSPRQRSRASFVPSGQETPSAYRHFNEFQDTFDDQESLLERTPIRPKKRDSLIADTTHLSSEKAAVMTPQLDKTDCQDNLLEEEAPSSQNGLNLTIPRRLIKHFHKERAAFRVSVGGSTVGRQEIGSPLTRSYDILSKEEQLQVDMMRTNSYIEQDIEEFDLLSSHQQESTSRNDDGSNRREPIENNPCFAVEEYQLDREPSEQELLGELNFDTALPEGIKSSRYNELQHENNNSMVINDDTRLSTKNPFICIRETDQAIDELSITIEQNQARASDISEDAYKDPVRFNTLSRIDQLQTQRHEKQQVASIQKKIESSSNASSWEYQRPTALIQNNAVAQSNTNTHTREHEQHSNFLNSQIEHPINFHSQSNQESLVIGQIVNSSVLQQVDQSCESSIFMQKEDDKKTMQQEFTRDYFENTQVNQSEQVEILNPQNTIFNSNSLQLGESETDQNTQDVLKDESQEAHKDLTLGGAGNRTDRNQSSNVKRGNSYDQQATQIAHRRQPSTYNLKMDLMRAQQIRRLKSAQRQSRQAFKNLTKFKDGRPEYNSQNRLRSRSNSLIISTARGQKSPKSKNNVASNSTPFVFLTRSSRRHAKSKSISKSDITSHSVGRQRITTQQSQNVILKTPMKMKDLQLRNSASQKILEKSNFKGVKSAKSANRMHIISSERYETASRQKSNGKRPQRHAGKIYTVQSDSNQDTTDFGSSVMKVTKSGFREVQVPPSSNSKYQFETISNAQYYQRFKKVRNQAKEKKANNRTIQIYVDQGSVGRNSKGKSQQKKSNNKPKQQGFNMREFSTLAYVNPYPSRERQNFTSQDKRSWNDSVDMAYTSQKKMQDKERRINASLEGVRVKKQKNKQKLQNILRKIHHSNDKHKNDAVMASHSNIVNRSRAQGHIYQMRSSDSKYDSQEQRIRSANSSQLSTKKSLDEKINPMELSVENRGDATTKTDFGDSKCESRVPELRNLHQVIREQDIEGLVHARNQYWMSPGRQSDLKSDAISKMQRKKLKIDASKDYKKSLLKQVKNEWDSQQIVIECFNRHARKGSSKNLKSRGRNHSNVPDKSPTVGAQSSQLAHNMSSLAHDFDLSTIHQSRFSPSNREIIVSATSPQNKHRRKQSTNRSNSKHGKSKMKIVNLMSLDEQDPLKKAKVAIQKNLKKSIVKLVRQSKNINKSLNTLDANKNQQQLQSLDIEERESESSTCQSPLCSDPHGLDRQRASAFIINKDPLNICENKRFKKGHLQVLKSHEGTIVPNRGKLDQQYFNSHQAPNRKLVDYNSMKQYQGEKQFQEKLNLSLNIETYDIKNKLRNKDKSSGKRRNIQVFQVYTNAKSPKQDNKHRDKKATTALKLRRASMQRKGNESSMMIEANEGVTFKVKQDLSYSTQNKNAAQQSLLEPKIINPSTKNQSELNTVASNQPLSNKRYTVASCNSKTNLNNSVQDSYFTIQSQASYYKKTKNMHKNIVNQSHSIQNLNAKQANVSAINLNSNLSIQHDASSSRPPMTVKSSQRTGKNTVHKRDLIEPAVMFKKHKLTPTVAKMNSKSKVMANLSEYQLLSKKTSIQEQTAHFVKEADKQFDPKPVKLIDRFNTLQS